MKKIAILVSVCLAAAVFGQKVSDYKYISIPGKFKDFEKDSYGLDVALVNALKAKKYVVVQGDKEQWPTEIKGKSCNAIIANLNDDSNFLKNRVKLEFKDCNDKVIFTAKGGSSIKEYKEGFQDALKQALMSVPASLPVDHQPLAESQNIHEQKETSASTATENKVKKYVNGKLSLQKVQIDAKQFILVDAGGTAPYATFEATSKKDIFRVKLADGKMTTGYFENDDLVIDMPQSNGEYSKEVFSAR
ncbi:MAG: hypothetical protein LBE92_11290 [Chryseobacterium sp.]|jgi:hypothetical protein|uniref:hypothetical protein n=1 Tax=Chryseobacterium sp. TaxID=1871047 RepID=UPI0028394C09|nr:hypothetical protein [Chryseobacterium sp.]MDR2236700.1 hypothetical protein [Chryseobacterium sp.]